ncbi:hypothetical protein F5887DRAFT_1199493 [Amanita rubescens]|nr:hypothetical protein F5887DRAFT_1199493 [Amanita rubescens]
MAFPADEAKLVSIFVQTLLYGAYTVLFVITTALFLGGSGRSVLLAARRRMFLVSILLFVIATTHISVNFTRIIKAFIIYPNAPGGPSAFFNRLSEFTQMFGSTLYVAQTLLGDALVIWRCYLAWDKNIFIVGFPILLLLGSTATGIGILYYFDRVVPDSDIFVTQLQQWIVSFFSMTLATNLIGTSYAYAFVSSLTGYGGINNKGIRRSNKRLYPVLLLIVESGAIYSAALLVLLILYKSDSWFQYVILDAISSLVGLVFSVIMYRILAGVTSVRGETQLLGMDNMDLGGTSHIHSMDGRKVDRAPSLGGFNS